MAYIHPISLCKVLYKIIAKSKANHLQSVIRRIIDEAQSAFILYKVLSENILIAHDILHTLRQKRIGKKGFMVLKLDMRKAFDKVEWGFFGNPNASYGFWQELGRSHY